MEIIKLRRCMHRLCCVLNIEVANVYIINKSMIMRYVRLPLDGELIEDAYECLLEHCKSIYSNKDVAKNEDNTKDNNLDTHINKK